MAYNVGVPDEATASILIVSDVRVDRTD